jgi:hypothetical protein
MFNLRAFILVLGVGLAAHAQMSNGPFGNSQSAAQAPPPSATPDPARYADPRQPPELLPYAVGSPIPAGYHLEDRRPEWAVVTGAALFTGAYLMSVLPANECTEDTGCNSSNERWAMFIPMVGPFIDMQSSGTTSERRAMDVFFASGQIAGATLFVLGLTMKTPTLVVNAPSANVTLAPSFTSSGGGLALRARL